MGNKAEGMYSKFDVIRTDGTSGPGGKHENCDYLVLDLTHDPHARTAALAYADSCEPDGYVLLAGDIREMVAAAKEQTDAT